MEKGRDFVSLRRNVSLCYRIKAGGLNMRLVLKPVKTYFLQGKPAVRDYFDDKGILILSKGQMITHTLAADLNSRVVFTLHCEWPDLPMDPSPSPCCPKYQIISNRVCPWVQPIYIKAGLLEPILFSNAVLFIDRIIQDLEIHPIIAADFEALRSYDNYTYMHSINVALLSYAIGTIMKLEGEKLRRLVLGALLHDIGKLTIPVSIINKPTALSDEEYYLVKTHPSRGFQRSSDFFLPRSVLATILEHHERWDGSGYPKGISQEQIHPYAQIVAVADVFDALIADRPYRPGFPPYHAIEMVLKGSERDFNPEVIHAFLHAIQIYPENSLVTLNSGESGVVIGHSFPHPTRPVIRILFDANGNPVEHEKIIDLIKDPKHFIHTVQYDCVR